MEACERRLVEMVGEDEHRDQLSSKPHPNAFRTPSLTSNSSINQDPPSIPSISLQEATSSRV